MYWIRTRTTILSRDLYSERRCGTIRRIRIHLGIIGAYAALALGVTYPLVLHLGTHVPMPSYLRAEPWRHVYWFHLWSLWLAKQQIAQWPPHLATDLIFYPIGILPGWAQKVAFLNPFVQVMQDVRHAILGGPSGPNDVTAATVYGGSAGRLIPLFIAALVFLGALAFFRREGRFFAERV